MFNFTTLKRKILPVLRIKILNIIIIAYFNLIPLLTFSAGDTIPVIVSWKLSDDLSEINFYEIDTSLENFQHYDIIRQKSVSNTFLGNPGQANISNIYILREKSPVIFYNSYASYLLLNKNINFYNTRKHFTSLNYFSNGSKTIGENWMKITHTQNINPYLNFGFEYRLISSKGQYQQQNTRNNSMAFFSSYNKLRYSIHATYNYNKFKINNNGGITDDVFVENKDTLSNPAIFPVNLNNSKSVFYCTGLMFVSKYKLGERNTKTLNDTTTIDYIKEKASVLYSFDMQNYRKIYYDDSTGFYQSYYFSNAETYDSLQYNVVSNAIQYKILPDTSKSIPIGISTTIKSTFTNYSFYTTDTFLIDYSGILKIKNSEYAQIKYDFTTEYFFDGFRKNDIISYLLIQKEKIINTSDKLTLLAVFERKTPDISEIMYSSNNYIWNMNFLPKEESNINLTYVNKRYRYKLLVNYSIIDNFIFFNENALPEQTNSTFNIFTVGLTNKIHFKKIHFNNIIYYQKSDNNEIIRLPEICYNNTTYVSFNLLKGILKSQIGVDVYYNTAFYGYSYSPALSMFVLQSQKKIGNYPYIDFFINFKLKRARIFVKYEHANHNLINRRYFLAYHYPAQEKMMKFGVSWNFYD